jgi:hypothetical protein
VTASRRDLGARDGRPGTGWRLLWEVQAVQEDTDLPVGWLRLQASGQGGAEPYPHLILGVCCSSTYLAWAAPRLPGVEVQEVAT